MFTVSKILEEYTEIMGVVNRDDTYLIVEAPNYTENHAIAITNRKDKRFCRISIFEPKYIGAEGEDYELTKEDLDCIIPIIEKNWTRILGNMNDQFLGDDDIKEIDESMPMPNYYDLLKGEKVL